ncbi:MAG: ABC transporter permease, partial [Bryobacteraceae bacterium]
MNRVKYLESIWQDTSYAFRTMRKEPVFAITAVLTLALAIGGITAMFTVIHAVLLKPLPYPDSERLVLISGGATPSRLTEMKASAQSFTGIGAYTGEENPTISGSGEPVVLKSVRVSANFLDILGVAPLRGRSFRTAEDLQGAPPVVMIGYELWQSRFAADPEILGKTADLGGTPYTIVGVLPPHFAFPSADVQVWMTAPAQWSRMTAKSRALSPFLTIFGRLKPGVSLDQASAEAKVIHHQYAMAHPAMLDAKPKNPVKVTAMKDSLVASVRSMLWMLLGAVGFVLLIACANVASLLLARSASRSREIAVRSALGALRGRLIRQLISESVVLSLAGGMLGLLLAGWSLRAIHSMTAFDLPRAHEVHLDAMVLGFTLAISIATGVLFGLAPALGASRPDIIGVLRATGEGARQTAHGGGLIPGFDARGFLMVGQVALSIVLLIGTALLIESVSRLRGVDVGFNPANLLTANISLSASRYGTDQKRALYFQELVDRVGTSPGIRSAAAAMFLPMMGFAGTPVQDAAKPVLKLNERLIATLGVVTPGYFHTLEIPFRRGRDFTIRDKEGAQRVAIIDEAMARKFWPSYPSGQDPIGQRMWVGGVNPNPAEIVGIVANVHQSLENNGWPETVYLSFAQNPQPFGILAVRTVGKPLDSTSTVREQVTALDRDQSISEVKSMDELVDEQVGERRLLAILLGSFASMAMLLVLMGIYGIIAYSVTQRTQEMGIRRALGAQQSDILGLVVGQSFRLVVAGVGVGVVGAIGLTRLMESLLFNVSPTDPLTFALVALLFLLVALAASYI